MLLRKTPLKLPKFSELELTRHFVQLSRENVGIDVCPYPLGSCTMKFNPRVLERAASLPEFSSVHPLAPEKTAQGNLELLENFTEFLTDLLGMEGGTFSPYAGAQGEFVGLHLIKAYHASRGEERDEILIPNAAHGTNPASANMLGYKIITLSTTKEGDVDLEEIKKNLSSRTAGLMLTNPNTLGIFSPSILQISEAVHASGGLLYYDGANLNPLMGVVKVGAMGFDVLHLNLHKTFATPHGSGGPGSGPVFCKSELVSFLPIPLVEKTADGYVWKKKMINRLAGHPLSKEILVLFYVATYTQYSLESRGFKEVLMLPHFTPTMSNRELKNILKLPLKLIVCTNSSCR